MSYTLQVIIDNKLNNILFDSIESASSYAESLSEFSVLFDDKTDLRVKTFNMPKKEETKKVRKSLKILNDENKISFYVKDMLKNKGARWDKVKKAWKIEESDFNEAQRILSKAQYINRDLCDDDMCDRKWESYLRSTNDFLIVLDNKIIASSSY
jgi:hypothetical protein